MSLLPTTLLQIFSSLLLLWVGSKVSRVIYNLYFHPLRQFPGPEAAAATEWWKTYVEVVKQESFVHLLVQLHERYGEVVRVGPNQLHFSSPEAYSTIYNANARWDKERLLYESFGEDHSSFGLRTYKESKERKDVLQPLFSRRAILGIQGLVRKNADTLISILSKNGQEGKESDLLFAFRCFAIDTITAFSFNSSVSALSAPNFAAPIVTAMDASLPTFHLFHHFPLFRKLIFSLPPNLAISASPETAGLTELQVILGKQVQDVMANPKILEESDTPTIYHRLLDKSAYKSGILPDETALLEEAQTMMFAGGVTVGDTLMTGFQHILSQPSLYSSLETEIRSIWKNKDDPPTWEQLETLPLLTACLKESLRLAPGACSPLLRIVPEAGAVIAGRAIPAGTIVGSASLFVHRNPILFPEPEAFRPQRWLGANPEAKEANLAAFSKGPRSCLGLNLAWCELYTVMASCVRCLGMEKVGMTAKDEEWRDCFTPFWAGRHLSVKCEVRKD